MTLKNVQIGDYIATMHEGWVAVVAINDRIQYSVRTEKHTYTREGLGNVDDKAPMAWENPPEWLLEIIGPILKDGDRVWVWEGDAESQAARRIYKCPDENGLGHLCYAGGECAWTSNGVNFTHWPHAEKAGEDE